MRQIVHVPILPRQLADQRNMAENVSLNHDNIHDENKSYYMLLSCVCGRTTLKGWFFCFYGGGKMKFFTSNETIFRLLRTIVQAVLGVIIANLDLIIGTFAIGDIWKPFIVALVMAVLSPIMAEIGKHTEVKE